MKQLGPNDRRFLVQLLRDLPDFRTVRGRQALIENAVSGYPKSRVLLGNVEWDGTAMVFASEVIRWFENFEVTDGVGALPLLVESIEPLVSAEQRALLQTLKQRYGWDAGPREPSPETSSSVRSILLLAADTITRAVLPVEVPIGVLTGLLIAIPYLGFALGALFALLSGMLQLGPLHGLVAVAIVYGAGQALESTLLTPRLVGERIGLHPLAVILALLAFGSLFGFVGVLLALPLSAVVAVGLRRLHRAYLASDFYLR